MCSIFQITLSSLYKLLVPKKCRKWRILSLGWIATPFLPTPSGKSPPMSNCNFSAVVRLQRKSLLNWKSVRYISFCTVISWFKKNLNLQIISKFTYTRLRNRLGVITSHSIATAKFAKNIKDRPLHKHDSLLLKLRYPNNKK